MYGGQRPAASGRRQRGHHTLGGPRRRGSHARSLKPREKNLTQTKKGASVAWIAPNTLAWFHSFFILLTFCVYKRGTAAVTCRASLFFFPALHSSVATDEKAPREKSAGRP
ncbi:hypothetical protein [Pandoravirus japonicus]|uniref:Uncharacterized protein n=1 Tax=Pandoravirus japonicus TaxID=2823154 RepID=A0A811BQ42_9VIRU|nr:hypothetical protein [Pandoravirus japonicus]